MLALPGHVAMIEAGESTHCTVHAAGIIHIRRQQYIQETDPEKQKALVEAMHRRLWEVVPYVPLGQLKQPFLWRKNISGVLKANTLVFWNIEKN